MGNNLPLAASRVAQQQAVKFSIGSNSVKTLLDTHYSEVERITVHS